MIAAGAYDGMTARLVELTGYDAVWLSGFCVSCSMGVPDNSVLTSDELVSRAQSIRTVTRLPLIVDCDEGYGSPQACAHLLRRLQLLGVWGASVEDNLFPKRNSFDQRVAANLLPWPAFADRLKAARQAAPDVRLIARTEVMVRGGSMQEALERCALAREIGAEYCIVHNAFTRFDEYAELLIQARRHGLPLVVVPTKSRGASLVQFRQSGFEIVIAANQAMRVAAAAMMSVLERLRGGAPIGDIEAEMLPMEFFFDQFK